MNQGIDRWTPPLVLETAIQIFSVWPVWMAVEHFLTFLIYRSSIATQDHPSMGNTLLAYAVGFAIFAVLLLRLANVFTTFAFAASTGVCGDNQLPDN